MAQGCPVRGPLKKRQLWFGLSLASVLCCISTFGLLSFSRYLITLAFFLSHSTTTAQRELFPSAVSEGKSWSEVESLRGYGWCQRPAPVSLFWCDSQGGGGAIWSGTADSSCAQQTPHAVKWPGTAAPVWACWLTCHLEACKQMIVHYSRDLILSSPSFLCACVHID